MDLIERMDPFTNKEDLMFPEHYARYMFASQFTKDKVVLDCSCGNGYGTYYIAEKGAKSVQGVDISAEAVAFSKKHFTRDNLSFTEGNALDLGHIEDQSIDVYICFETIEHIEDTTVLLKEVKRVLKPDGVFLVSCPNDHIFNPDNPFHVDVYDFNKFSLLLEPFFKLKDPFVQNNINGTSIYRPEQIENANELSDGQEAIGYPVSSKTPESADTWLYVCSDVDVMVQALPVNSFFPSYSQFVIEMQDKIQKLYEDNQKISLGWEEQKSYIKSIEDEHAKYIHNLENDKKELLNQLETINQYVKNLEEEHKKYIENLESENARLASAWQEHKKYIQGLEDENSRLAASWEEHTNYIRKLEEENKNLALAWEEHDAYIKSLEMKLNKM